MVEGGLGGGSKGGEGCKVGDDNDIGGAEVAFVVIEGKDVVVPKEGEICKGWGLWWREVGDGTFKEHCNAADVHGIGVR